MSQHPSLRSKEKGKQHRSVLKRYERVKELKEKEKWQDGDSVFGLLKLKILKFKLKKEKAAPAADEGALAAAEGAPQEAQTQAQEGAKGVAGAKATPEKKTEKKEDKKK
ncbi:MAG: small basic protein [Candidatus Omnitrophica bacterium]|nr:small basic protein [Candidatus Omnitrophota bacterium]